MVVAIRRDIFYQLHNGLGLDAIIMGLNKNDLLNIFLFTEKRKKNP